MPLLLVVRSAIAVLDLELTGYSGSHCWRSPPLEGYVIAFVNA